MKMSLFRKNPQHRDILAIDPRAVGVEFSVNSQQDNDNCGDIAVVSVCGPLEHHRSFMWDSYDAILERLEAAFASDEVKAVVMCIDSPGGDAAGATEAHRRIRALRKKYDKPLLAYSNESMYSAAYSIGSAADEIWVPETGGVGSVGVICMLLDKTKQNEMVGLNIKLLTSGARKADSHADRELTDDVVDAMQSRVDYLADVFFRCVAKARNMTPKAVKKLEAGIFMGQSAVDSGLADGVAGWYKFLQYVSTKIDSDSVGHESVETENPKNAAKEHTEMKTIAQLKKERELAEKKLAGARSNAEYKKLFAAFEETVKNLAAAEIASKTKYVKKTEERLTKDDGDDDDDTEETEEEEEEEETEASDDDDTEESEEESEESTAAASAAPASISKKQVDKLFHLASKLTGCSETSEILGALEGITPRVRQLPKIEQRVASLETRNRKERVTKMLDKAKVEGRITPAQANGLMSQGLKDPKWLKGYLSAQPAQVRSIDDGGDVPDFNAPAQKLDSQNLTADQKKMLQQAAQSAGMTVEDYSKEIEKTNQRRAMNGGTNTNGALGRY